MRGWRRKHNRYTQVKQLSRGCRGFHWPVEDLLIFVFVPIQGFDDCQLIVWRIVWPLTLTRSMIMKRNLNKTNNHLSCRPHWTKKKKKKKTTAYGVGSHQSPELGQTQKHFHLTNCMNDQFCNNNMLLISEHVHMLLLFKYIVSSFWWIQN
jgi:hypothetical protein